jgi:two-component system, NtrC family, sensor kinase
MNEPLHRILVVDDNRASHDDLRKSLIPDHPARSLDDLEARMLASGAPIVRQRSYEIDSAYQGEDGFALVQAALAAGRPYALAFVDLGMPEDRDGWDGLETIRRLWTLDASLQVVLCAAYSDHSWRQIAEKLELGDGLVILKKPFHSLEALQLAGTMARKWSLHRQVERQKDDLETAARWRTNELEQSNASLRRMMDERQRYEVELRLSQKLEAVGRLASGIAHEINTPVQFVSDSVEFVRDALGELLQLRQRQLALIPVLLATPALQELAGALSEADQKADLEYISEHMPKAVDRALHGLERVARLVRSMKEFASPDSQVKAPANLNEAIASTLVIAPGEYKYVAELETDYGVLPPVNCLISEINQVVLNIVVNAAHAVADVVAGTGERGRIRVSTRAESDGVVIAISDTGGGVPLAIRDKIFDPFFTTKEIGRGTGQGLAMARSVVVERHGGSISFESELGRGTTFFIRLPTEAAVGKAS